MIKVGLIGNGSIAQAHLSGYSRLFEKGEAEVVAFCDIRPERLEAEHLNCFTNARTYKDVDEMLKNEAGNLDYIDICAPTYVHAELAIKVMKADIHCLCEKPMARTVEQAEEMLRVSKETGKTLMIAHCCRFHAAAYEVKKLVEEGKLGKPVSADFRRESGSDDGSEWFREYELSGGATLDFHIHDVDLIRWIFGMPKSLSMVGGNHFTRGGGYDLMSANFMYDNMFVNATCNWYVRENFYNLRTTRVNFEKGYVYVERGGDRDAAVIVTRDGEKTEFLDKLPLDGYFEEIKYFVGIIRDGKKPDFNPPEDSVDVMKLVMAEIESADKGGEKIEL